MGKNIFFNNNNKISRSFISNLINNKSFGYEKRLKYSPRTCSAFNGKYVALEKLDGYEFNINLDSKKQLKNISKNYINCLVESKSIKKGGYFKKKLKIGIIFSGGPAPGGHNVISGLFDALKKSNKESILFGFIMGFDGMINCNYIKLSRNLVDQYRNIGGFDLIMTGRRKLNNNLYINSAIKNCKKMKLDGIVIVGGDDSNTNAAFLSERLFLDKIKVIGIPKTIDRDLQFRDKNNKILCSTSFGFDTASKNFSYSISNLCNDVRSDAKYWHFCKVMGRAAGHLALEIAYQTHAHLTIVGEELIRYENNDFNHNNVTLDKIIGIISNTILKRAKIGKNFGIIVIPEGILEFVNEISLIINKVGSIISEFNKKNKKNFHHIFDSLNKKITYLSKLTFLKHKKTYRLWDIKDNEIFSKFPKLLKKSLLSKRDDHGNFQFSCIETEKILVKLLEKKLNILKDAGEYTIGIKKDYYNMLLSNFNLDINGLGKALFKNWGKNNYLIFHNKINNKKKLLEVLLKNNYLDSKNDIIKPIEKIFELSRPKFKSQIHFYGYDGRSAHPTNFDCTFAYNLGLTAFHLINNNASGLMASILNLEHDVKKWVPIGIPIHLLMNLEIRNGKDSLVIKKTVLDLKSLSFKIFKKERKKWMLSDNNLKKNKFFDSEELSIKNENSRPITLILDSISIQN